MSTQIESRHFLGSMSKAFLAVVIGASLLAHAPSTKAQMATAEAGPSLPSHILNQINTLTQQMQDYAEYGEELTRWKSTWDHYYQQIARFMSVVRNPMLAQKVPFTRLPMDYGVNEKCGGSGGFSFDLKGLASTVLPDMNGDIRKNQQKICAQIQMLENQKHNALVDYVAAVAPTLAQDLKTINTQRAANNQQGTVAAIAEGAARLEVQQKQSEEDLNNQIKNCDTMIAALTRMQRVVATRALKGKPDPVIGALVKTAVLETALKAGK